MDQTAAPKWYRFQLTEGTRLAGPWLFTWATSTALLDTMEVPIPVRVGLAFLPLLGFGWFLWRYLGHLRGLDELAQRIELEALAIAFPLSIGLLMTMGQLQVARQGAGWFPVTNWFWGYLVVFYLLGRGIARRRYA